MALKPRGPRNGLMSEINMVCIMFTVYCGYYLDISWYTPRMVCTIHAMYCGIWSGISMEWPYIVCTTYMWAVLWIFSGHPIESRCTIHGLFYSCNVLCMWPGLFIRGCTIHAMYCGYDLDYPWNIPCMASTIHAMHCGYDLDHAWFELCTLCTVDMIWPIHGMSQTWFELSMQHFTGCIMIYVIVNNW